jgi:hypothetical protein
MGRKTYFGLSMGIGLFAVTSAARAPDKQPFCDYELISSESSKEKKHVRK